MSSIAPQIALRAFTDWGQNEYGELAEALYRIVAAVGSRLKDDFPHVVEGYATPNSAMLAVGKAWFSMQFREQLYGAFAVMIDNKVAGVATYAQRSLMFRERRFFWLPQPTVQTKAANGPLLTVWLADSRSQRCVLPKLLQLAVSTLGTNPDLAGKPYTLVRPAHHYVRGCLLDPQNGFGGFGERDTRQWNVGDGVTTPRTLMIARYNMDDIRARHG